MKWKKLGRIYVPTGEIPWMHSHAANPLAHHVGGNIFRIYFNARDTSNRSVVSWLEIDILDPCEVLRVADKPALAPGLVGTFDDSGCSIGSLVSIGGKLMLYYMGWNLGVTVPWRNSIGLACSEDGGETFARVSIAPLLDRSQADPYSISYPWVMQDQDEWHMWYGSNLKWGGEKSDMLHLIKYASSPDGLSWTRDGKVVIERTSEIEYAFSRPCVIKDGRRYLMWYSYRGDAYKIGYAESINARTWERKDSEAGLEPAVGAWDGEGVEYPCVFDHAGGRYMLYCGDGFGRSGFGVALLESK